MKIRYVCDRERHLICCPYSKENLHKMARELNMEKKLFKSNHYSIPEERKKEIEKVCQIITTYEIEEIIQSPKYAAVLLSDEVKGSAAPADYFLQTQIQYNGI